MITQHLSSGSSRPAAPAGVRVTTLGPHGHRADSFNPGKTFDGTSFLDWPGKSCSLGFLALDYSHMEAFLASFGMVAIAEMGERPSCSRSCSPPGL